MKNWRVMSLVAAVAAVATLAAGCGSSDDEPGSPSNGGDNAAGIAAAKAYVADHQSFEDLDWPEPPEEPFDPGAGEAAVIVCSTAGAGCLLHGKEAQNALRAAGWDVGELGDGEFTPSVYSELILNAVQDDVDGIVLVAVNPATVRPAIEKAASAGIPMVCVPCAGVPDFPAFGGSIPMVNVDDTEVGKQIANFAIANSDGDSEFVQFVDNAYANIVARGEGIKAALDENCPDCSVEEVPFAASELAKPGPPVFSATLAANPDLDWVLSPTDTYTMPMVKTAQSQRSEIKFASSDAEIGYLNDMIDGENAMSTVWQPISYMSWSAVDNLLRLSKGLEPWDASRMPSTIVTEETAPTLLEAAPDAYSPPSFDFVGMYEELWAGE